MFAAGWAQKLPCRGGYGRGNRIAYARMCYSDVHVAWTTEGLDRGKTPYVDHPVEYPVLLGGLMALASVGAHDANAFFDRTSGLLLVGALVVTATTALVVGGPHRTAVALVPLAPAVILHGTVSWDFAAAAFAGLAILAWARRRPLLAGVALGLGAATKLYPIIFAVPLFALCLRARQLRAWTQLILAAVTTWAACYAAVYWLAGTFPLDGQGQTGNAVWRFFVFNRQRPADWDSLWFVVQEVMTGVRNGATWAFPVATLNALSGTLLAMGMAALAVVLWKAPQPPRVAQALFLATAVFVLSSKVYSPQFTIWLVPLAVLARPRWLPIFGWQLIETVFVVARFQYFVRLSDPHAGVSAGVFVAAVVARDLALVALMYTVLRDIWRPQWDDVRVANQGDPAAGVLTPPAAVAPAL
jgi:uncharacterized membrane protein